MGCEMMRFCSHCGSRLEHAPADEALARFGLTDRTRRMLEAVRRFGPITARDLSRVGQFGHSESGLLDLRKYGLVTAERNPNGDRQLLYRTTDSTNANANVNGVT